MSRFHDDVPLVVGLPLRNKRMYRSLRDAKIHDGRFDVDPNPLTASQFTEIWYQTPDSFRRQPDPDFKIDSNNLEATHVLLGRISETGLEQIFRIMQGEFWSPNGEANDMIRRLGLGHTSMSVGDVVRLPDGKAHVVANVGFQWVPKT